MTLFSWQAILEAYQFDPNFAEYLTTNKSVIQPVEITAFDFDKILGSEKEDSFSCAARTKIIEISRRLSRTRDDDGFNETSDLRNMVEDPNFAQENDAFLEDASPICEDSCDEEIKCNLAVSDMYPLFRKLARRYTGKLFKTLIKREPRFDRRAIKNTLRAIGQIWDSGLGRPVAIDILRHTVSELEDEARVLDLSPDNLVALERVLFGRAIEVSTLQPVCDGKTLNIIRRCSTRLFALLKRSQPRWNRTNIVRTLSLVASVWESGLGRVAAVDAVSDALADREEEARALGVDPSDPDDVARMLFSAALQSEPYGVAA